MVSLLLGFLICFFFRLFLFFDLNLQYETKPNPKLTTPFLASLKSSMVFGNVFSSLKIACLHKTGKKTPKLESKEPPPRPEVSRRKVGLSPALLTSAPSRGLGKGGFCRVISIQSWFWKGHPGFATPSAMVVNCIQEQWSPIDLALQCTGPIHYKKKLWLGFFFFPSFPLSWVFVFPSQIRTALLHVCLVQSTEHSTAGPNWPLSARKWERAGKHPGQALPTTPSSLGELCPGLLERPQHRASIVQGVPGKH